MANQSELCKRVVEYLDSQGWHYDYERDNVIGMKMSLESKLQSCAMLIFIGEEEIQAYAVSPLNAEKDTYADVVEFITRANYGLKVGGFEFDYRDGEVRYHTCLPCGASIPELSVIERVIDIPFLMLQRYGDGLAKNIMGYGDPESDISKIEG